MTTAHHKQEGDQDGGCVDEATQQTLSKDTKEDKRNGYIIINS